MKPVQVKPEKQGQAQGNSPDLIFSLIIGHNYNVSEYPSDQHIIYTTGIFPPTSGQALVAPLGNISSIFPLHYS